MTRGGDVKETVTRKKRLPPPVKPKVTGEVEARLIALACTDPPGGQARWTLRLLEKHVLDISLINLKAQYGSLINGEFHKATRSLIHLFKKEKNKYIYH